MPVIKGLRLLKQIVRTVGDMTSLNDELEQKRGELAGGDGLPPPDRYLQYQAPPAPRPDPLLDADALPSPDYGRDQDTSLGDTRS